MPTIECLIGELRGELRAHMEDRRAHDERIEARFDVLEEKVTALVSARDVDKGAWGAYSKVGAGVVAALGLIGYVATNGLPDFVKRVLH